MTRASIYFVVAALSLTASQPGVATAQQQTKFGVVDMQRAAAETEDGLKAKESLKKLFEQRQKTLDKQQNDLKTLKESLETQRSVLSEEVRAKKMEDYQKAFSDLQTTYLEFQRELAAKEGELTKPIIERLQRILRRMGQRDGYSMILERGVVVYIPSTYDLTDVLIQRYNAGEGRDEEPKADKPQKAAPAPKPTKPAK